MNVPVSIVSRFPLVGLSGSRRPGSGLAAVAAGFVSALAASHRSCVLAVGCAAGIDAIGRSTFPASRLQVFSVQGLEPWRFAARSAALVSALAASGGCLVSFPGAACPAGIAPCAAWRSAAGSGSWGSLALALGLAVPVLLYSPGVALSAPAAIAGRFAPVASAPGWWWSGAFVAVQHELF